MTAKTLNIRNATRFPNNDKYDNLVFNKGVNVIVGNLNSGKTKWLQMLDFVLGDNGKVEDAFGKELSEKYDKIVLNIAIGDKEFCLERRWKEAGLKSKIIVNDEDMTWKQFSAFILGELNIPIIHIPSGNPYSDRTWPELSWREMFRHIYKQERFWSDFVPKQTEIFRSACIFHFFNVSANLYPKEYGELVSKKKAKEQLEAQKEVFSSIFEELTAEIIGQFNIDVTITQDSILQIRKRLTDKLREIDVEKDKVLQNYNKSTSIPLYDEAKKKFESLTVKREKLEKSHSDVVQRLSELKEYITVLEIELTRFKRVKTANKVFADLKVTHCPACDQKLPERNQNYDCCSVCGQNHIQINDDIFSGSRRIEFEEQQISEEIAELYQLVEEQEKELYSFNVQISEIIQQINKEDYAIRAAQKLNIHLIPPELAIFDQEIGRIGFQLQQLERLERSLKKREEMDSKIVLLENNIEALNIEIEKLRPIDDYKAKLNELLSEKMNSYIEMVGIESVSRWKTGLVSIKLGRDTFDVFLNGEKWTVRAGGTALYVIQIAYHYALLSLACENNYNYPGFLIIDFPPHFTKAEDLQDSENYLLKPFVDLCAKREMSEAQVIIAGRAFDNLDGANIIHL